MQKEFIFFMDDCLTATLQLDMSHVGLGTLDEYGLMVMFGNNHSRFLTEGLEHNASQIVDVKDNILYPTYFMTHLRVPPASPLSTFSLWDNIHIETRVKRYGDTILDSSYRARKEENGTGPDITMQANSLFILDPVICRAPHKQVSAPKAGAVREMQTLSSPPDAIQKSARVRSSGFDDSENDYITGEPYFYTLESNRDTVPGHPLIFAKIPFLMELSERDFLRRITGDRISEEILQSVSLLERMTFYYGNAFAGSRLTLHTKGFIESCNESLCKENSRLQHTHRLAFETELYDNGELLAVSRSDKTVVHEVRNQSMIQDSKRLFKPILCNTGVQ